MHAALKVKNKTLKKGSKGNNPNAAESLTDQEISIFYKKGLLGVSNSESLINTL